ncbi:hypothetical protein HY450_00845 [Candidatus Pacearchaeota archaeon]|nr:hypothetical protein [Candidatus Pacearchaeota archaeon]
MHGFTQKNWKMRLLMHPTEDAFGFSDEEGIIAVADGVTRDPKEYLPNMKSFFGKLKFLCEYPNPSPAQIVSDICVSTFIEVVRDYRRENRDTRAIWKGFEESNRRIKRWNEENIVSSDYVTNDFAGCVAAGTAFSSEELVSYGFLTDAGIAIFDEKGEVKFRTENEGPNKHDKYIWQDERLKGNGWRNPEVRRIIRRDYRNNPHEKHSFGVLTGEPEAMSYVRTGTKELKPGEGLTVYTDGLESTIFSGKFADLIRRRDVTGIRKLCKREVRTEGSLVYREPIDFEIWGWSSAYQPS